MAIIVYPRDVECCLAMRVTLHASIWPLQRDIHLKLKIASSFWWSYSARLPVRTVWYYETKKKKESPYFMCRDVELELCYYSDRGQVCFHENVFGSLDSFRKKPGPLLFGNIPCSLYGVHWLQDHPSSMTGKQPTDVVTHYFPWNLELQTWCPFIYVPVM